jgi:hypothetical protein
MRIPKSDKRIMQMRVDIANNRIHIFTSNYKVLIDD